VPTLVQFEQAARQREKAWAQCPQAYQKFEDGSCKPQSESDIPLWVITGSTGLVVGPVAYVLAKQQHPILGVLLGAGAGFIWVWAALYIVNQYLGIAPKSTKAGTIMALSSLGSGTIGAAVGTLAGGKKPAVIGPTTADWDY
jgi:hypothetical protein